jgi:cold shock CspA family protein
MQVSGLMRFEGKLEKWNDDRGFGFITPSRGGDPVFVHISAFQSDGRRPRIGEPLTFEVEPAGDGKRRAVNVQRPGHKQLRTTHTPEPRHTGQRARTSWVGLAVAALLVVGGVYAYTQFSARETQRAVTDQPSSTPAPLYSAPATTSFKCDGRTRCSQMTSCEEATFFLRNCPGTQMDGNGDGIPCEKQWCGGSRGR